MSGALVLKGGYYSSGPTLVDMGLIADGGGHSWTTGATATIGGQIGALRLRAQFNFIDGVQGAGSGVMLPSLAGGQLVYVFNRSGSDITIWVAVNTTDTIVGVGTSETLPAGATRTYVSVADGWIKWVPSSAATASGGINVVDYGAKGDGVTDDTAALQAAANAIPASGGTLYVPRGTYLISGTIFLKSSTLMRGDGAGSVILASATGWVAGTTYQLVMNQNYLATTITDHDIAVENLQFDFGSMPNNLPPAGTHGAYHAVNFYYARNVQVRFCLFQGRGTMNDATAICACDTSLVEGCVAYGMVNASYDHWLNPQNARVVNCFASGAYPCVFFNPEPDMGPGPGNAANNYLLSGCTLINTRTTAINICQLEPLDTGTTVSNITVTGNHFVNAGVYTRGAVTGVVIADNTFSGIAGCPVIDAELAYGVTPEGVVISGNVIENPASSGPSPIHVPVAGAVLIGNRITGTAYGSVPGIDTGTAAAVVVGNSVSNGRTTATAAVSATGNVAVANGQGFTWFDSAGSPVQISLAPDNHYLWYGTNATGGQRLMMDMYQRSASSAMNWSIPLTFAAGLGAWGSGAPASKPTVTGAKGGNAALASLMTALVAYGLVTDSTT